MRKAQRRRQRLKDRGVRRGGESSVGFEFFTHNVTLLITALEHPHGASGPADCDLGSTSVFRTSTQKVDLSENTSEKGKAGFLPTFQSPTVSQTDMQKPVQHRTHQKVYKHGSPLATRLERAEAKSEKTGI